MSNHLLPRDQDEAIQAARAVLAQSGIPVIAPGEEGATGLLVQVDHHMEEEEGLPWVKLICLDGGEIAQVSRWSRWAYQTGLEVLRADGWRFRKRPWGEIERYPQLQRTVPASVLLMAADGRRRPARPGLRMVVRRP